MIVHVAGALDAQTITALRQRLADDAVFTDGRGTAAGLAREVKHNEQLAASRTARAVERLVAQRLQAHPVFAAAAQPRDFARIQVSRYQPGMAYGLHVDAALMDGRRCDLSFTCFLSEPDAYDGGELVVHHAGSEQCVKLPPGDCCLYPAGSLHRVNEVRRGERLAVVGWVRSLIRDHEQRALLFELDNAMARLNPGPEALSLARVRNGLLRMWAED